MFRIRPRKIIIFSVIAISVVILMAKIIVPYCIDRYKDYLILQLRQISDQYLKDNAFSEVSVQSVPNIVHYILFGINDIQFSHYLSVLSVLKNQKPSLIYIHCDCDRLTGQYWERAVRVADKLNTTLVVRRVVKPTEIFGHKLSTSYMNWHSSDITRILVLKEFGGIYLDRDVYVIQPMDHLFKYELSLDFQESTLGNQVIVARKDARFLHLWLQSYRFYFFWEWQV